MKKRNKKWADEKEFLRLKRDLQKNRESQSNLGWVELEKPIFIGWNAKLEPREDIKNRDDAWVFEWISKNVTTEVFSRKIENFSWNRKNHRCLYKQDPPHVRCIPGSLYNDLHPQIRKYFTLDKFRLYSNKYKHSFGDWYICNIPDFYFEIKYIKAYKTKVRLIDEILLQEENDLKKEIQSKYYDEFNWYSGAPRYFRNGLNRIQRRRAKEDIRREINGIDSRHTPNYKDAKWLWW